MNQTAKLPVASEFVVAGQPGEPRARLIKSLRPLLGATGGDLALASSLTPSRRPALGNVSLRWSAPINEGRTWRSRVLPPLRLAD